MRFYMNKPGRILPVILILIGLLSGSFAGTTGKILGVVKDKDTGKVIAGANILLEGTHLGAATDLNGMYLILNIPPGYYDLSASMIGYKTTTVQGVQVSTDRTITVNFALEPTVLEAEAIVVQAERPMVRRDQTNKMSTLDFTVFNQMPIQEFSEAVAAQAGMITDEAGDLHLRGGRSGEIAYMIDGVLVQDPFYKSGAADINLDKYLIQELQVQTGAFGAEYGQAMSGVINVVTKEGDIRRFDAYLDRSACL